MKIFKRGDTFTEGINIIIQRNLDKHKNLLEKDNTNLLAMQNAIANEVACKRFYREQKGKRNYKNSAMDIAIEQMNKNINNYTIDIKLVQKQKVFNTKIVDTLTSQLKEYYEGLKQLSNIK